MDAAMFDISACAAPAHHTPAGEPFRDSSAAVAFDRIVGDCLDREWIITLPPQPNKARHGRKSVPPASVEGEAYAC